MRTSFALAVVLAFSTTAVGQESSQGSGQESKRDLLGAPAVQVVAGAGFGGFTSDFGNNSSVGAAWTVRGQVDVMRYFGAELNYQGSSSGANTIVTPTGTLPGSHLTSDQLTGDAVLKYPLILGHRLAVPYGFVGIGYGHIGIDSSLHAIGLTSQNAAVFPVGAGMSYSITQMFLVDARYTYNVYAENFGNAWNVAFNLGARFQ